MGLFKQVKKRYNTVDKKITMFDRLRSDSPQRQLPSEWEVWKAERAQQHRKHELHLIS